MVDRLGPPKFGHHLGDRTWCVLMNIAIADCRSESGAVNLWNLYKLNY